MMHEREDSDAWPYRDQMVIADEGIAYLDGNSLGRLPRRTVSLIQDLVNQQWGATLIGSWNAHWLALASRIGDKIGRLIGAPAGTTLVCDSTSINLYKLAWAMLQHAGGRRKIVTDRANFPSDLYILDGLADQSAGQFILHSLDLSGCEPEAIESRLEQAIDSDTALVSLSHVHYKSGYAFDLARLTRMAHERGARVLWDLSHSVGALPIDLIGAGADGAVGCTYKYLNGGPGAPAFLYVREDLHSQLGNPIQGWFGAHRPFDFSGAYEPSPSIARFAVGTPAVLSLAAIEPGVDLVLEAGIENLHHRSIRMSEYLIAQFDCRLAELGYRMLSPRQAQRRGSHVSIGHPNAWQITQALIERYRVVPDFRGPDTIRFGITPLYTNMQDIEQAIGGLVSAVRERSFESFSPERYGVT